MLCYAVLCCAMLCYAVLCCAMLCFYALFCAQEPIQADRPMCCRGPSRASRGRGGVNLHVYDAYIRILYDIIIYYMCVLEDLKQLHLKEFSTRCVLWLCCQVAESTEARLEVFRMETELKIIWHSGNMWKLEISLHTLAYIAVSFAKVGFIPPLDLILCYLSAWRTLQKQRLTNNIWQPHT